MNDRIIALSSHDYETENSCLWESLKGLQEEVLGVGTIVEWAATRQIIRVQSASGHGSLLNQFEKGEMDPD